MRGPILSALCLLSCAFLNPALAAPTPNEVFRFGEAVYQVPFIPDSDGDEMLRAGIAMYEELTELEKIEFQALREANILAQGWFLTYDFFSYFARPVVRSTSDWWKQQQILSQGGRFDSASAPPAIVRRIIHSGLQSENKKLWRNPRLAIGKGYQGITIAVGHVMNSGAFQFSHFRTHMVGITCFRDPARGSICSLFYDRERGDDREPVKFSLEWGLTFRLQWVRTDGVPRAEVDGVHLTAMGPGAFGSTTGSIAKGWSSTLSYFEVLPTYIATVVDDPAVRGALLGFAGWMWWIQNIAVVPTVVRQFHTEQFEVGKIGDYLSEMGERIREGSRTLCSRLIRTK